MFYTASHPTTSHSSGLLSTHSASESSLLSDNSNTTASSILSPSSDASIDVGCVGGKDILFGNPDLLNMGAVFMASGPQVETAGSIAFEQAETSGSIAFSGAETAGSVACGGGASIGGDGGGCGGGGFSSFC